MLSTGLTAHVAAFGIDACETTAAEYRSFALRLNLQITESLPDAGELHPVVNVTWYEADRFCREKGGRLPTEAEWERAALGGKSPYVDHELGYERGKVNLDSVSGEDVWEATSPAGAFAPNSFGVHDAVGNAAEWVDDWFKKPDQSGKGLKVLRGGSWLNCENREHLKERTYADPGRRFMGYGFRCAYGLVGAPKLQ